MMDDRPRPAGHRWRLPLALLALLALEALAALGLEAYQRPWLRVWRVEVVGVEALSPWWVREQAALYGASTVILPIAEVRARLAESPLVKEVHLERLGPQAVRLQVTERQPWGYWQAGSRRYTVDQEGVVLGEMGAPWDAPVVVARESREPLRPGDRVDGEALALARTLAERLPEALGEGAVLFEYSRQEGLAVITEGGYRLAVGDGHSLEYKLALARALKGKAQSEGLKVQLMDLRFGDRPALR